MVGMNVCGRLVVWQIVFKSLDLYVTKGHNAKNRGQSSKK